MGGLPPVFIEFLGHSRGVKTAMADVKAELAAADAEGAGAFRRTGMLGKAAIAGIGIAAAGVAVHTVKMAGDFQQQMTRVRTGAGEAAQNMRMVGQGVLAMAGHVGQSTGQLTKGLYTVESAGYHGADALKVLETSAMGAKVGAADLATVTDAVTTAMNAYKLGASDTTTVMNALVATESEGKTNLEALAGSMSGILPVAAAAKVKLNEVLGAMATMTSQGTDARVAATYLRQTIGNLANPTAKAAATMKGLGLSSIEVQKSLGKRGLAATLDMLTDAIKNKMGPDGTVLIGTLQKAASSGKDFQSALNKASGSQKTYIGALATMVGGTKSMQAALQLTGPHMKDFIKNTQGIDEHVKKGGKSVEGWADVQQNFNQKMAEAKASVESLGIQMGQYLMPAFQRIVGIVSKSVSWLARHRTVAKALAVTIGVVLVAAIAAMTAALYEMAAAAAVNPITWIVLAVIALIAGIVMLALHWRQVWSFIKRMASDVARAVVSAWHWLRDGTLSIWHSVVSFLKSVWHSVAAFFSSAWHTVTAPIISGWHQLEHTTSSVWHSITGFLKSAWNSIKSAASSLWSAIVDAVTGLVTGAAKRLQSLWSGISSVASSVWQHIKSAAASLWASIKSAMIDPIVGAWHSITSTIGKIASGIKDGLHNAWNAVKNIGSNFLSIGKNIIMGIVHGIENAGGAVLGALKGIASSAMNGVKDFLGIHSPSRKFAEIGAYVGAGLVQGLTGSTARVQSAANRIAGMLYGQFGSSGHKHLQELVRRDGQHLVRLAKQRDDIAGKLKTANKKLTDLQKAWKRTRDEVAKSVMENVSVVTDLPEGSVALTRQDVVAHMREQVAKARKFAAELVALRKKGLSADLIQQIASAGVDQGGATAEALATADPSQIAEINKLQRQAKSAAGAVGSATADAMYKTGIDSAKGLIRGLKSQQKSIEKAMEHIAKAMRDAIKRALKIKSPSQVFHEIGDFVSQGLATGITAGTRTAEAAAHAMAGAVSTAGMPAVPKLAAARHLAGAGRAGSSSVLEHTTVVQLDGEVLFKKLQRRVLQHERRNTSNGLSAKTR